MCGSAPYQYVTRWAKAHSFGKILIYHKIVLQILGKTTGSTKNFMYVCIALLQGEITLQSAKSIYHMTPQFIRS